VLVADWGALVRWTERVGSERNERTIIKTAPVEVGPFLRTLIWDETPTVFVSATLSVGGDFAYFTERVGISDYLHLDVGTPFDYPEQALLYVPANIPEPGGRTKADWDAIAPELIGELVRTSGGGALVLFTSRTALNRTYDLLADALPFPVRSSPAWTSPATTSGWSSWTSCPSRCLPSRSWRLAARPLRPGAATHSETSRSR
jgi:Rad3-related DNA helicase